EPVGPMTDAVWLPWTERDALADRLEELALHFPARRDFELWRAGALGAFIGGGVAFVGTAEGGWLLQGGEGLWVVTATLGSMDRSDLRRVFQVATTDAELLVWDEDVGEGWVKALADLGARPFVRQAYVQDLAEVAFREVPDQGITITPWGESGHREAAAALLVAANARNLEGVFLTAPKPPTAEHCEAALKRVLEGSQGAVLPWASGVATEGDREVGVLLCVQGEAAHQGVLFDLYVDPAARGKQLSRRLVAAMQRALLDRGYRENRFMTMGENAPVHRLFREEEIAEVEETRGGYWRRG
ncbi:MAG: GNAT family N-acetyltransferase, partial [Candidatus Sericytochromatia bacterium]